MTPRYRVAFIQSRFREQSRQLFDELGKRVGLDLWVLSANGPMETFEHFAIWTPSHRSPFFLLAGLPIRLKRRFYDAIVVPGPFTIEFPIVWMWSKIVGVPLVVFCQEWAANGPSKLRRFLRPLMALFLKGTASGVVSGRLSRAFLMWCGMPEESVHTAIGTSPIEVKADHLPPSQSNEVLFVGRLIPVKGVDILLQAFARVKDKTNSILRIVGEGPDRGRLEKLHSSLNLKGRVFFEGWVSVQRLAHLYGSARVVVLPSRHDPHGREQYEVWGYVLPEAAQFGRPLIATTLVGASADFVLNGVNGFVVPAGDADALSRALLSVLIDNAAADKMGEESLRISSAASLDSCVKGFMRAISAATTKDEGKKNSI